MKDKIVLNIGGEEMIFSEKELALAVEYYFAKEFDSSPKSDIPGYRKPMLRATSPVEGKWFMVNPMCIDRKLFEKKRENSIQEEVRKTILTAFVAVDRDLTGMYRRPFETIIPVKEHIKSISWAETAEATIRWFDGLVKTYDNTCSWANRIEQYLEWAQRIQNGESWESLCNLDDQINRHRLVTGIDKKSIYTVGGSYMGNKPNAPAYISKSSCIPGFEISGAIPLVVRRPIG